MWDPWEHIRTWFPVLVMWLVTFAIAAMMLAVTARLLLPEKWFT